MRDRCSRRRACRSALDDTTATLTPKIAQAGAELLIDVLPKWERGEIAAIEQDEALATYAPQLEKADALIDWEHDSAEVVVRKVRAYNPWPIAYGYLDGQPLRIFEATAVTTTCRARRARCSPLRADSRSRRGTVGRWRP